MMLIERKIQIFYSCWNSVFLKMMVDIFLFKRKLSLLLHYGNQDPGLEDERNSNKILFGINDLYYQEKKATKG